MQGFRRITVIFLLTLFGLTLAAEIFDFSVTPDICSVRLHADTDNHSSDCEHATSCSDPCHQGQSHFGHCPYAISGNTLYFYSVLNRSLTDSSEDLFVDGPCLEGPRRPPRA